MRDHRIGCDLVSLTSPGRLDIRGMAIEARAKAPRMSPSPFFLKDLKPSRKQDNLCRLQWFFAAGFSKCHLTEEVKKWTQWKPS